MNQESFRQWLQRPDYAVLSWYSKAGRIYFPAQSDVEALSEETLGDHIAIYTSPIPFGPTTLVYDEEEMAWTFAGKLEAALPT